MATFAYMVYFPFTPPQQFQDSFHVRLAACIILRNFSHFTDRDTLIANQ